MVLKNVLVCMAILYIWVPAANASAQQSSALRTDKEKTSYAIGVDLARKFQLQGINTDVEAFLKGMHDVLSRSNLRMTEEDIRAALNEFQSDLKYKRARAIRYVAEDNKIKGDAFLAANRVRDGVVTLPSGLQYKILTKGSGAKPMETDAVEVKFRGTFIDGTEFDSSGRRGQPATFKLMGVIPGWNEALQLMPVGSKWQLFVPPELAYGTKGHAYGTRGSGLIIGPNTTLIFEIELLAIK